MRIDPYCVWQCSCRSRCTRLSRASPPGVIPLVRLCTAVRRFRRSALTTSSCLPVIDRMHGNPRLDCSGRSIHGQHGRIHRTEPPAALAPALHHQYHNWISLRALVHAPEPPTTAAALADAAAFCILQPLTLSVRPPRHPLEPLDRRV